MDLLPVPWTPFCLMDFSPVSNLTAPLDGAPSRAPQFGLIRRYARPTIIYSVSNLVLGRHDLTLSKAKKRKGEYRILHRFVHVGPRHRSILYELEGSTRVQKFIGWSGPSKSKSGLRVSSADGN